MNNFKLLRGYDEERRIFRIDAGNIDGDVGVYMERMRQQLMVASRIPMEYFRRESLNEPDIFIPIRNNE